MEHGRDTLLWTFRCEEEGEMVVRVGVWGCLIERIGEGVERGGGDGGVM